MTDARCNACGGEFRRVHPLMSIIPALECEDCGRMIPQGVGETTGQLPRTCSIHNERTGP